MSIDALRDALPEYAKDLAQNLVAITAETTLTEQQKWGCLIASAYALGQSEVIKALEAASPLSEEALKAAKGAAAIMSMNNIYYRALHLMKNPEYRTLPARLRMSIIANPGVAKADFELWSTAVSAVNVCGMCLDAHEEELRKHGVPSAAVLTAVRIAAVVNGVSRVMAAEAAARS
jgi:alkyl hydroperoxide reductase subunit D